MEALVDGAGDSGALEGGMVGVDCMSKMTAMTPLM